MSEHKQYSHILVATDGSKPSQRAVAAADAIAAGMGLPVVIIAVASKAEDMPAELLGLGVSKQEVSEARKKKAAEVAEIARQEFVSHNVEAEIRVVEGDPAECVIRISRDYPAPMLVVGRRGLTGFRELVLGSVSHKVVQYADCPVLVVN